jgi:hypothetical protein
VSYDHTTLELFVRELPDRNSDPIVLLPQAPGSGVDVIARSLVGGLAGGHWQLLPAPAMGVGVLAQRAWHRDCWVAMPAARRDSVALVTGTTAGFLAPVLADAAHTVVLVRDPLVAVHGTGDPPLKRSALERLADTPAGSVPARMLRIANPQSRALLAPWHDPAELSVSVGPPVDADRWRDRLFAEILPRLDVTAIERAPVVARDLAQSLGARPKPVVQAAKAVVERDVDLAGNSAQDDVMLRLNWLDAELYELCGGSGAEPR